MTRKTQRRPISKRSRSAGQPASSGEIAFEAVADAESYMRPLRCELSRLDLGGDFGSAKDAMLVAVEEMRRMIRADFREETVPDFYPDNIRDAINAGDVSLTRFTLRCMEQQIMRVIAECEIERLDPTWSKRGRGRPSRHLEKAREFVDWHKLKPTCGAKWIVEQEMCLNAPVTDHYNAIKKGLDEMEAAGEEVESVRSARDVINAARS